MAHVFLIQSQIISNSEPDYKKNPLVIFSNFKKKTSHIWQDGAQPTSYFLRYDTPRKNHAQQRDFGVDQPRLVLKDQSLQPRHSVGVTNANPLPGNKA